MTLRPMQPRADTGARPVIAALDDTAHFLAGVQTLEQESDVFEIPTAPVEITVRTL